MSDEATATLILAEVTAQRDYYRARAHEAERDLLNVEVALAQERDRADAVRRSNAALVEALDAERARAARLLEALSIAEAYVWAQSQNDKTADDDLRRITLLASPPAPYLGPGNVVG